MGFSTSGATGAVNITAGQIGLSVARPSKVEIFKVQISCQSNYGMQAQLAIPRAMEDEAKFKKPDDTAIGKPFLVSEIPRTYTLRNTRSADYSFFALGEPIAQINFINTTSDKTSRMFVIAYVATSYQFAQLKTIPSSLGELPVIPFESPSVSTSSSITSLSPE